MIKIKLGDTEMDDGDCTPIPERAEVLVYSYHYGDWEGIGYAAYLLDGEWHGANLSHCSCYGPADAGLSGGRREYSPVTDEFMREQVEDATTDNHERAVYERILRGEPWL